MVVSEISTSHNESLLAISLVEENGSFVGSSELSISCSYASEASERLSSSVPNWFHHEESDRHSRLTQSRDFDLPFREEKSGDEDPVIENLETHAAELRVGEHAILEQIKRADGDVEEVVFHEGCKSDPQNEDTDEHLVVCLVEEPGGVGANMGNHIHASSEKLGAVELAKDNKQLQDKEEPLEQQGSVQSCPPQENSVEVCGGGVVTSPCCKEKQEEGAIEVYNIGVSGVDTSSSTEEPRQEEEDPRNSIDIYNIGFSGITVLPSCEPQPQPREDKKAAASVQESPDTVAGDRVPHPHD